MATNSMLIEEWADEVYELAGKETSWSVSEVRCPEEGCPPVETVLTDLSVKRASPGNGVYKIFKAIKDVTKDDVQKALACAGATGCDKVAEHKKTGGYDGGHAGHGNSGHAHGGYEGHDDGHAAGHSHKGHDVLDSHGDCCGGHSHDEKEGHAGGGHGHGH
eukprot:TRINITY_DN5691_c0_g1_i6.p1 TRINITY_DN5691_c0_g1~~TRINITY_DN5691_c0_g1_i6.p1  ORF type:complete len:161 (+),score=32.29 TRINITY_DN5691_c0_g1_i6:74-556(+)